MSGTDTTDDSTGAADGPAFDLRLEVVVLPVTDVDRAKAFYHSTLGYRLDADVAGDDGFRVVQLTPPGSACSIIFGSDLTSAVPGGVRDLMLVVSDLEAVRNDLVRRGVEVSEVFHDAGGVFHHAGTKGRVPGPAPERTSYGSFASYSDPDGNGWVLQEITTRLPGRRAVGVDALAALLEETAEHHDPYEKASPPHHWWDWYAPYLAARQQGAASEEAAATAAAHVEEVRRADREPRSTSPQKDD
ncbi:VOC family protein [Aquihabitans sp. McL0605]|uniref:VOC family protein n=1 Tax=Aquihabitans sp. McL0605 TaxID=3415671 RepID=UPI003CED7D56